MSKKRNVKMKPIELVLDKPRTLFYDFNSFIELEDKFGSVDEAIKALQPAGKQMPNFRAVRSFIWAGLIHEDESLTEVQVGKILGGMESLEEIMRSMNAALNGSLPEDDGSGKNEETPAE